MNRPHIALLLLLASAATSPTATAHAQSDDATAGKSLPRVAVLCVGENVLKTGVLQRTLDQELADVKQIERVPTPEVAVTIGAPDPRRRTWPPAVKSKAAQLLREVQKAYYRADLDKASEVLRQVEQLHRENEPIPVSDRLDLLLTRAAVLLASGQTVVAEANARSALILAPDREVDLNVFPPDFADFIDHVRGSIQNVNIVVSGLPPGASVRIDDRPTGTRFKVPAGTHVLTIEAPGFRTGDYDLNARRDVRVIIALPVALDEQDQESLAKLVWSKSPNVTQRQALRRIADKLEVSGMVVAGQREVEGRREAKAYVWWRTAGRSGVTSRPMPGTKKGLRNLSQWAAAVVAQGPPSGLSRLGWGWRYSLDAGVAYANRSYLVTGLDGSSATVKHLNLNTSGAGPRVRGMVEWREWIGEVDVTWVTYRLTNIEVTLPDGVGTVSGGDAVSVRAGIGYRYLIGMGNAFEPLVLHGIVGGVFTRHFAEDPSDAFGPLGLLPTYSQTGLDVRAEARFSPTRWLTLFAGGGIVPFSSFTEDPVETTGTSPSALSMDWGGGLTYASTEDWQVSAVYTGLLRNVSFSDQIVAPTPQTNLTDGELRERVHLVTLSVRRAF